MSDDNRVERKLLFYERLSRDVVERLRKDVDELERIMFEQKKLLEDDD